MTGEPQSPMAQAELAARALDPTRSVVVSACAGSGKTWLLVGRIFRLLLAGARPSEILAITFTRRAAQEMAARLQVLLETAALADDGTLDALLAERAVLPRDAQQRAAIRARARSLYEEVLTAEPGLTLATFHSWFLQLVQRAPLAAGTVAGSTLAEANAALIDEALQRFGVRAARTAAPGAAASETGQPSLADALDRLFADCGLEATLALLRSFIARRAEWWAMTRGADQPLENVIERLRAALPEPLRRRPAADPRVAARADAALSQDLVTYRELLVRGKATATDRARGERIGQALAATDPALWFEALCSALFTGKGQGAPFKYESNRKRQERLGLEGELRLFELNASIGERLDAVRAQVREQRAFAFNAAAFTCAVALLEAYDAVKQQRQVVDFADLERHACELLTDDDHAAFLHARLDSRYRHLLLDEFQDTNPLQWMALRAWLDAAQAAASTPTVFLVGDPKQSIYRFRGAEARLFDAARDFLVAHYDADVLDQDTSRRCAGPVIDLVNALFAGNEDFVGFRTHAAFDPGRPGRVEILPLADNGGAGQAGNGETAPGDGADGGTADAAAVAADADDSAPATGSAGAIACRDPLAEPRSEAEDRRVAREAAQLVEGLRRLRGCCVLDERGGERPVAWRDVLVLVRTRGKLAGYERALRDASIPFNSSRQGGLLDTLEVRDLRALLRVLVAPHDDLALAHALRSPVFSLSDDDLVAVATAADPAGGAIADAPLPGWHARLLLHADGDGASAQVRRAAGLLQRWSTLAATRPVHDLLDAIYFESDLLARYCAAVSPAAAPGVEANLLALLEQALSSDAGRFPTLSRFLDELDDLAQVPAQEAPDEANPGAAEDAVRIMTVHGAKGLEAPIVWLLDCASVPTPARGNSALVDWPAEAPGPEHFSFWTRREALGAAQLAVFERARQLDRREDLNLLYVAVTRARQVLVVSGHRLRGDGGWYARMRSALLRLRADDCAAGDAGGLLEHGDRLPPWPPSAGTSAASAAPSEVIVPAPDLRLAQPLALAATDIAAARRALREPGLRYGDAFHRLMERITAAPAAAAVPLTRSPQGGLPPLAAPDRERLRESLQVSGADFDRLWQQAGRVLDSPTLARYFDPGQFLRARNEVACLDGEGNLRRIDRLVEFEREVWVLDYKTGDPAELAPWLEDYRAQLAGYVVAVQPLFPGRPVHAALVLGDGSLLPLQAPAAP